jgi:MHS family alpha-ketoglutarate permease-like MFS transporter
MAEPSRRGFYSGIWQTTTLGGQCLALITLLIIQQFILTPDQLKEWGWRLPFLFGAALAVSAIFMRRDLKETDHFVAAKKALGETGTAQHFFRYWKTQLLVVGFTAGGISAYYTYTTYMQKFIRQSVHLSDMATTEVAAAAMVFAVILQPLMGALSDRIGRKPLLMMFGILGTTCTYPLLTTLHGMTRPISVFLLLCVAWIIASGYTSITAVVKAEMFPTSVRAMGIGVPYAITAAVFGGTVDGVAQYFRTELHFEEGFYWYASALIFMSFLVYAFMPDSRKNSKMEQHE